MIVIQEKNKAKHNLNWQYSPEHPYTKLIFGSPRSEKIDALFNLINHQPDTNKVNLNAKVHIKHNINFN